MKRWELQFLLLKSVHMIDINQDQVIRIISATEVAVVTVIIEICAVMENSEVIIAVVDMVENRAEVIPSRRDKISY
jgi:hypothetical protein